MKIVFEHDLAHNYVIPEAPYAEQHETEYEIHMLEENQIPGFMKCVRKKINGKNRYYYEITSRQSLTQICETETLKRKDIRMILQSLYLALQQVDRYLLDGNKIILEPELIYMDIESREAVFCYLPSCENRIQDSFRVFASYLLYHLNHTDTEAVLMVFEINRKVQETNYALMDLLQEIQSTSEPEKNEQTQEETLTISPKTVTEKESTVCDRETCEDKKTKDIKIKEKKTKEKKTKEKRTKEKEIPGRKLAMMIVTFLVTTGLTAAAVWMELLTVTQAGGIMFLIVTGILYAVSGRKKAKESKRTKEKKKTEEIKWEIPEPIQQKREKLPDEIPVLTQEEENIGATTLLWKGSEEYKPHISLISMNPRERNSVVLIKDSYIVGKLKSKADILIDDKEISRVHAKIQKEGEDYYLYDLNSTNGTFLNGKRLGINEKAQLHVGDEITFAGVGYYVGNC